jgi:spoIIIJ-associated protein
MASAKEGEFHGKTVEEAIEAGLAALGLKREQVTVEVLSKGSRGLLGFGAEDARVFIQAVEPAPPAEPVAKPAAPPKVEPKPAPAAKAKPVPAPKAEPRPTAAPKPKPPVPAEAGEEDISAVAMELLQGMLDRMDLKATVEVTEYAGVVEEGEERPLVLNIEGDDLGVLIGRRGETLAAIQYLLRLMVNHRVRKWTNLEVDVEGYKARREEQLRSLAQRMAERAISSGRAVTLEAMPARERRIIHITLRDNPQVTTQSFGEDEHRKVSIIPK